MNAQGSGHWVEPSNPQIAKNADLYKIAYEEAQRTLDDQAEELSSMRTRSVQFLAFVGSATAFLAGTGIRSGHRSLSFAIVAVIAAVISFASIGVVCAILSPWAVRLGRRVRPGYLLKTWIERDVPVPNAGEMYRELALHFEEWRDGNDGELNRIRRWYVTGIGLGAAQLIAWAIVTAL